MLLKHVATDSLIEVNTIEQLINPIESEILGQEQSGEEEQDSTNFLKQELIFPSGENLPRCWMDADYRKNTRD
ncbi:MAG: acetyltransferase [Anaerolineae bacterium]|nr:acetyltransferase [Gloeobacterales cyanobacterium ES-bin-313]